MTDIYIVPAESRTYIIPFEAVETIADREVLIFIVVKDNKRRFENAKNKTVRNN